jgi:hypothetical protein
MGLSLATSSTIDPISKHTKNLIYAKVDHAIGAIFNLDGTMDFEQISLAVAKEGQAILAEILKSALEKRITQETETSIECTCCGRWLRSYESRSKAIATLHGSVEVNRPYYYCKRCKKGFFPTDEKMGLVQRTTQLDLQRKAALLTAEMPFEQASRLFKELTGHSLSDHTMHDIASDLSEVTTKEIVLPTTKAIEKLVSKHSRQGKWRPIVAVFADGAMMPTRPESAGRKGKRGPSEWKEAKGFRIMLITKDEAISLIHWHEIGTEEEFGNALEYCASLIPQKKVRIGLIADGSAWIWNHFQRVFPDGKEVLDYYHCKQNLYDAAKAQFEDPADQAKWAESTISRLFMGEIKAVLRMLKRLEPRNEAAKKELEGLANYLTKNQNRIDYKNLKKGQYPIGSGAIESANRFICQIRLKRPGAWWYKVNANSMLRLRCAIYNGTFEKVFAAYKKKMSSEAML